jgi:hypothetical protein
MLTVRTNHTYSAEIDLSWLESWADSTTIAARFTTLGFTNVHVAGTGQVRFATGTWSHPDVTLDPSDPHLRAIREMPPAGT